MGNRTYWSGPIPPLGTVSNSPAIAAVLTDVSPQQTVIQGGQLEIGTRIRLVATGNYSATSATPTLILGFYMNQLGIAIGTTPAVLAASPATNVNASAVLWPWQMFYYGQVRQITSPAAGTNAQVVGQGTLLLPASLTSFSAAIAIPATAAARTVAQTATGLLTNVQSYIAVGSTWSTVTGVTSLTCDELTLELVG